MQPGPSPAQSCQRVIGSGALHLLGSHQPLKLTLTHCLPLFKQKVSFVFCSNRSYGTAVDLDLLFYFILFILTHDPHASVEGGYFGCFNFGTGEKANRKPRATLALLLYHICTP